MYSATPTLHLVVWGSTNFLIIKYTPTYLRVIIIIMLTEWSHQAFVSAVVTLTHKKFGAYSHVNYLIQKEIQWKLALESTYQCQVHVLPWYPNTNY